MSRRRPSGNSSQGGLGDLDRRLGERLQRPAFACGHAGIPGPHHGAPRRVTAGHSSEFGAIGPIVLEDCVVDGRWIDPASRAVAYEVIEPDSYGSLQAVAEPRPFGRQPRPHLRHPVLVAEPAERRPYIGFVVREGLGRDAQRGRDAIGALTSELRSSAQESPPAGDPAIWRLAAPSRPNASGSAPAGQRPVPRPR